jgi:molybdate transport system substrate-binding protein
VIKAAVALFAVALLAGCQASPTCACAQLAPTHLNIFAASSLSPAFEKMGAQMRSAGQLDPQFTFAGTQTLTTQITEGASADVFASADTAHMEAVQKAGLLDGSPQVFAHNWLEIAVAKGNPKGINGLADLTRPGIVVVLADPSVPAGKYAQQALAKAHVTVHPASLELQVTGVMTKIQLGEADAGIVYASDIFTSSRVDGVPIAADQNVIADYPIGALKGSSHPAAARAFLDFVLSPEGQGILKSSGFLGM